MSGMRILGREGARSEKTEEAPKQPRERSCRTREVQAVMVLLDQQAAEYRRMTARLDDLLKVRKLRHRAAWTAGAEGAGDRRRFPRRGS